jgi:hypothetical protein
MFYHNMCCLARLCVCDCGGHLSLPEVCPDVPLMASVSERRDLRARRRSDMGNTVDGLYNNKSTSK